MAEIICLLVFYMVLDLNEDHFKSKNIQGGIDNFNIDYYNNSLAFL